MAKTDSPGVPLQEDVVKTTAAPAANGTATGSRVIGQAGYVSFVAPAPNSEGLLAALYGIITLTRSKLGNQVVLLWAGYIRAASGGVPSLPGAPCENGDTITLTVHASTSYGGTVVPSALFRVTKDPGPALPVWNEPVGSGPGDYATRNLGNPAAGAAYAAVTVGARTQMKLRGLDAQLVADVHGTAFRAYIAVTDGAVGVADMPANAEQASLTTQNYGMPGFQFSAPTAAGSIIGWADAPNLLFKPGWTYQVGVTLPALVAGDNWSQAYAEEERWAVIA